MKRLVLFAPRDSVVKLGLGTNGSYYTKLNGKIVDSATYKLTMTIYPSWTDTIYALHNFARTVCARQRARFTAKVRPYGSTYFFETILYFVANATVTAPCPLTGSQRVLSRPGASSKCRSSPSSTPST